MDTKAVINIQLFILLSAAILYFAKPVLMPLAIAGMFALVFMPVCRWLESKGCHTIAAALICGLLFALLVVAIVGFLIWHVQHIAADFSDIRQHFTDYIQGFRKYLHDRFGMDTLKKDSPLPIPVQPNSNGIGKIAASFMGAVVSVAINLLLILVYMIMLLCLRHDIRSFLLRISGLQSKEKTDIVILQSAKVVQQYLWGLSIVIICLWIMYSIGFTVIGIHNAIFFAILCGILEIIPFVGNITGTSLTCLMALSQGGGFSMVLAVIATYMLIQGIQFYIISPLVMQIQVSIHPLFTIVVLFAGDLIWGIAGMILAIPALGIVKIVCDHIDDLQPLGRLLGRNRPIKRRWSFSRRQPDHDRLPGP
ncbi:MAG TPA: AI-2E family transporter [Puia sp.]|nr:AI-2E family transporter [Puia sp.]